MISSNFEKIKDNADNLVRIEISFAEKFEACTINVTNEAKISATTEGIIKDNEIYIDRHVANVDIFVNSNKSFKVNVTCVEDKRIKGFLETEVQIDIEKTLSKPGIPTIFTGKKGFNFFVERIKDKIFKDITINVSTNENELQIKISGNKTNTLLCLGTEGERITSEDLVFGVEPDIKELNVPLDFLFSRFGNEPVAFHVLVKPDFQKKIKNTAYKTRISDFFSLPEKIPHRMRLQEFKNPCGKELDPLEWIINSDNQLPEFINE